MLHAHIHACMPAKMQRDGEHSDLSWVDSSCYDKRRGQNSLKIKRKLRKHPDVLKVLLILIIIVYVALKRYSKDNVFVGHV